MRERRFNRLRICLACQFNRFSLNVEEIYSVDVNIIPDRFVILIRIYHNHCFLVLNNFHIA